MVRKRVPRIYLWIFVGLGMYNSSLVLDSNPRNVGDLALELVLAYDASPHKGRCILRHLHGC